MAIALVQKAIAANSIAATVACTWPATTTAGSLLVMGIYCGGGTGTTLTTPTGWTKVGEVANGTNCKTALYYIENASARSGTESLTLTASQAFMTLAEYSGVATSTSLETSNSTTGTGLTGGSGSVTTTNANDLLVAVIGYENPIQAFTAQTSPTNSFMLEAELQAGTHFDAALLDRIVSSAGTYSTTTTINKSIPWSGFIGAFKAAGIPANSFDEVAPGVDIFFVKPPMIGALDEDAPGTDAIIKRKWTGVFGENAPQPETLFVPPRKSFNEIAPGGDGTGSRLALCTERLRTKYCPNCSGGYHYPYTTTRVSQNNQMNFDPSPFFTITSPVTTNSPFTIPNDRFGVDVETPIEAALSWWRPLNDFQNTCFEDSSGFMGDILPDDPIAQLLYLLTGVSMGLKVTRTGTAYSAQVYVTNDGFGGHVAQILSQSSRSISDVFNPSWNAGLGDPNQILANTSATVTQDGAECFEVNPYYDGTNNTAFYIAQIPTQLEGQNSGYRNFDGVYSLNVTIWDTVTFAWQWGYYIYDIVRWSCCDQGCPPCTTPVTIPSGGTAEVCLSSQFIDCSLLPGASSITGGISAIAAGCTIGALGHCQVLITVPCITLAQIAAGGYEGPYTVTIPTANQCTGGDTCLCEILVGVFYISVGSICDHTPPVLNPFNWQDVLGNYHSTGLAPPNVQYDRSNFGSNAVYGFATSSQINAPAGKTLHDPRAIKDNRSTTILTYAQQVTADSSWDGVYYARSEDDGNSWNTPVLAITGGKHPTVAIGQDGAFVAVIIAAYVGPGGGPGVITAMVQNSGDTAFGAAYNLKDDSNVDIVAADDTFHLQQATDDQNRWVLHMLVNGEGATSHWESFDDCLTFRRVT